MVRVLIVAIVLMLAACSRHETPAPVPGTLAAHCTLIAKEATDRTEYCGKACQRRVFRYAWHCPGVIVLEGT